MLQMLLPATWSKPYLVNTHNRHELSSCVCLFLALLSVCGTCAYLLVLNKRHLYNRIIINLSIPPYTLKHLHISLHIISSSSFFSVSKENYQNANSCINLGFLFCFFFLSCFCLTDLICCCCYCCFFLLLSLRT